MKKFPHQQFIEDNKIDTEVLPEMLQKRIKGFNELEEDLEHTTDQDKVQLMDRLETLSHELAEDMEEQFEDNLENNDLDEDEQQVSEPVLEQIEEVTPVSEQGLEISEKITENELVVEPKYELPEEVTENVPIIEAESENNEVIEDQSIAETKNEISEMINQNVFITESESEIEKEQTDENILDELLKAGKQMVLPSELRDKGFKSNLKDKRLFVGKFCLSKGKYDICYKITMKSE